LEIRRVSVNNTQCHVISRLLKCVPTPLERLFRRDSVQGEETSVRGERILKEVMPCQVL